MLIVDSALWSVEEKKKSGVLGEKTSQFLHRRKACILFVSKSNI